MEIDVVGQLAIAVLGVGTAVIPLLSRRAGRRSLRDDLRTDVELLKELPAESAARAKLTELIEHTIDRLASEHELRRDPASVGLGIALILVATVGGVLAVRAGGGWLWAIIPVGAVFAFASTGFAQGVAKTRRDHKGRPATDDRGDVPELAPERPDPPATVSDQW